MDNLYPASDAGWQLRDEPFRRSARAGHQQIQQLAPSALGLFASAQGDTPLGNQGVTDQANGANTYCPRVGKQL